ncbi:type III secretion apparatus [Yersinia frederiksenii]|nr:type III secretion apparatus [Yersinia frederiksenii]
MRHITGLEDSIKNNAASIQDRKALLRKERLLISHQLSLLQTPDNYRYLNDMMLALKSADKIIEILGIRYGN